MVNGPRRGLGLALLALLSLWCVPHAALGAPSAADRATAEALFDQAIKLMESDQSQDACPKLEESQRLDPGVGTLLYLAECYRTVGRTASAWATCREASYAAQAANQPDREQVANAEAERLRPSLRYFSLVVADKQLANLEIRRDGQVVNRALWGSPIPIDPGPHEFQATAPGKQAWTQQIAVETGPGTTSIEIPALVDDPNQAAPPAESQPAAAQEPSTLVAAPTPADTQSQPSGSTQRTWGLAALGVGGVGLAVGGVFGYLASQDKSAADEECRPDDPTQCNQEGVELSKQAKSRAGLATLGFGIGLAAVTTGVVLLVMAPDDGPSAAGGGRVWLAAGTQDGDPSLSLGGTW